MPLDGVPPRIEWTLVARPFAVDRETRYSPAGLTIEDMLLASDLPRRYWNHLQVFVDDEEVPRFWWSRVRPKASARLFVRVNALGGGGGGGGGKSVLSIVASLAVIVFAAWAAPMITASLFGTTAAAVSAAGTFTAMGLTKLAVGAAITMIGSLAISAIAGPPSPANRGLDSLPSGGSVSAPVYAITGVQNKLSPYGAIPRVYGRKRMFPILAAKPYSETVGNVRYIRLLLLVGYGPLKIEDILIGTTPISAFDGVESEIREGWADDDPITLYTQRIEEDQYAIALTAAGSWRTVTTRANAREISLDISFDRGLAYYENSGARSTLTVAFEAQYRKVGATTWIDIPWKEGGDAGFETAGLITISDSSGSPVRRGGRFDVPEAGQYEVRVRRTTADTNDVRSIDTATLSALRTITNESPINMQGLALVALRLKSYEQLNNQIQQISVLATSYLQVWDGAAWAWELSRNPAWAYTDALKRRGLKTMLADSRIDLETIKTWADDCAELDVNGEARWTFDAVIEGGSILDTLQNIASHVRARYGIGSGGRHSVVRDIPQSVPVLHITPKNSYGYKGSRQFIDLPHALKVRWINPDRDWQEDERIVYADGYDVNNANRFETVDMMACTRASQAWREGRYHLAVGRLRRETHEVYQDVEALRATDGDLVMFSHDVILVGLASGRIKARTIVGPNVTALVLDEPAPMATGKTYALRVRRSDGASQVLPLTTVAGESTTVTLATPLATSLAPAVGDLFQFGESGLEAAPMLVKGIEPGPQLSAKLTLVPAAQAVHDADTGPIPAFESYITRPSQFEFAKPPAPVVTNVVSDETALVLGPDGRAVPRIMVTLGSLLTADALPPDGLQVRYRRASPEGDWSYMAPIPASAVNVPVSPVEEGVTYDVELRYISPVGVPSDWTRIDDHYVSGREFLPPSVEGFRITGRELRWDEAVPLDVIGQRIRWNRGVDYDWGAAQPLHTGLLTDGPFVMGVEPSGQVTLLIKHVDSLGNESLDAAAIVTDLGDVPIQYAAARIDFHALGFPPSFTSASIEVGTEDLIADEDATLPFYTDDSLARYPLNDAALIFAQTFLGLTYECEATFANIPSGARLILDQAVFGTGAKVEYRSATPMYAGDDAVTFYPDDAALMYPDNPNAWADWLTSIADPPSTTEFRVTTQPGVVQGRVSSFEAILDAVQIVESLGDIAISSAGTTRLPITKIYNAIAAVSLTLQAGTSARRVEIVDKDSALGPLVRAYDASNALIDTTVDAVVFGY